MTDSHSNNTQLNKTLSPAAQLYFEVFKAAPTEEQQQALEGIRDLERWKGLLAEWKLNGWNPNIGSTLDRYRNGKKPKTTGVKRKGKVARTPQVADSTEEARAAARLKAQQRIAARRAKGFVPLEER